MDRIRELKGIYVALLEEEELLVFEVMIEKGLAFRDYSGPGGFLGLAVVGIQ